MKYNGFSEEDYWDLEEELLLKKEHRRDKNAFMDCRHNQMF